MLTLKLAYTLLLLPIHADHFFKICMNTFSVFQSFCSFLLQVPRSALLKITSRLLYTVSGYGLVPATNTTGHPAGVYPHGELVAVALAEVVPPFFIYQLYNIHLKISKEEFFYGNAYTFSK